MESKTALPDRLPQHTYDCTETLLFRREIQHVSRVAATLKQQLRDSLKNSDRWYRDDHPDDPQSSIIDDDRRDERHQMQAVAFARAKDWIDFTRNA